MCNTQVFRENIEIFWNNFTIFELNFAAKNIPNRILQVETFFFTFLVLELMREKTNKKKILTRVQKSVNERRKNSNFEKILSVIPIKFHKKFPSSMIQFNFATKFNSIFFRCTLHLFVLPLAASGFSLFFSSHYPLIYCSNLKQFSRKCTLISRLNVIAFEHQKWKFSLHLQIIFFCLLAPHNNTIRWRRNNGNKHKIYVHTE